MTEANEVCQFRWRQDVGDVKSAWVICVRPKNHEPPHLCADDLKEDHVEGR